MSVFGWAGWGSNLVYELADPQSSPCLSLMFGWVVGGDLVIMECLVS